MHALASASLTIVSMRLRISLRRLSESRCLAAYCKSSPISCMTMA